MKQIQNYAAAKYSGQGYVKVEDGQRRMVKVCI